MTIIAVSDTHFGFEKFNKQEFIRFLNFTKRQNPDKFLLIGDIFEFWRDGIESSMANNADIISKINDIHNNETDVIIIAGNHDWRLVTLEERGISSIQPPWNIKREFKFTSGNKEFIAKHGHQFDLANANPLTNRLLCLTDDDIGTFLSKIYSRGANISPAFATFSRKQQLITRPSLRTLSNLSNPNILAEESERERVDRIRNRIQSIHKEFIIFGHTHVPEQGNNFVNLGSWTLDENTYVQIENGQVDLITFK